MGEIICKFIGVGYSVWIRNPFNWLDFIVVVASLLLLEDDESGVVVLARIFRFARNCKFLGMAGKIIRISRLCLQGRNRLEQTEESVKNKISQNKLRFVSEENGFDLDLTYITDKPHQMIAMGVPAQDCVVALYRNNAKDVARFFNHYHKGHFKIYNCCPELPYDKEPFEMSVREFDIQDHTPPTMDEFIDFLIDARDFCTADDNNVFAVHCKGGKGRTGSVCCAWLMYSGEAKRAREALNMFADRRTDQRITNDPHKVCGVETPSQVRYVYQLWNHLKEHDSFLQSPGYPPKCPQPSITLREIRFKNNLMARPGNMKPLIALVQCGGAKVSEKVLTTDPVSPDTLSISLKDVVVQGDFRVSVFEEKHLGFDPHEQMMKVPNAMKAKGLVLLFLVHTNFMFLGDDEQKEANQEDRVEEAERIYEVDVAALDKAHKKVKKGKHSAGSSVELVYSLGGRRYPTEPGPEGDVMDIIQRNRTQSPQADSTALALTPNNMICGLACIPCEVQNEEPQV